MFPQPTLPLTLPSSCHLSLTLDQKTSRKWLKKRNHAEPRTLIRSLYWQKTGTQSPRQAAFNLFSFDLHRLLIFPGKKKKSLPCPSQLFSLILVLQSRLYWIPRGHCGCCSLTHVLSFRAVQTLTLSGQQAVHISGVRHSWRKRVRDGSGVRHSDASVSETEVVCVTPDASRSEHELHASVLSFPRWLRDHLPHKLQVKDGGTCQLGPRGSTWGRAFFKPT